MGKAHAEEEHQKDKELVEKAHEEDDDILWVTDFEEDKAKDFVEKLIKVSTKDPKKPIIVYIDSYGGSIDALSTMVAALDAVPNKIITACMGKAISAGAMLFSYGDVRFVSPHGRVMIHEVTAGAWGNINDLKVSANEVNRLNDYWMGWLGNNCGGRSRKQIIKCFTNKKRDLYMTPDEAVAFGIADKVGVPKLKKVVRYEVEE